MTMNRIEDMILMLDQAIMNAAVQHEITFEMEEAARLHIFQIQAILENAVNELEERNCRIRAAENKLMN